ncbi:MAG: hypothetical protein OR997_07515 [Methylophilaceae bacterium]|nr:hypothetical protein [Methylophilaceae bacterium]
MYNCIYTGTKTDLKPCQVIADVHVAGSNPTNGARNGLIEGAWDTADVLCYLAACPFSVLVCWFNYG